MEGGVDFISSLPEDVLRQIVSLIPCKEALRTAILSDKWRNLWSPFHVDLGLDSTQKLSAESKERLTKIFGELLKSFDFPEKLKFCFQSENDAQFNDEFLAVVTKGTQNELYFDFSSSENSNSRFNLVLDQMGPLNLNCPGFSSLKSLQLRLVPAASENVVPDLFSSFQFLENLTIEKCRELRNIDIRANDSLTSLTILDCCNIDNIRFLAPKLTSFSYRGHLPDIELIDAPNLIDVTLDLKDGLGNNNKAFDCEDVLCLLSCFKDVEKLKISGWLLEWLCSAGVIFKQLEFKFTKLKELWCFDSAMNKCKRDSISCFLDATPIIEKLFVMNDPKCMNIQMSTPYFHTCWHDQHLWRDCATVKRNGSSLKYLKQIELLNFTCKEKDEVLFMDLMLHRAVNLKSMMMISPDMDIWKVNVVPSSQVNYQVKGHSRYMVVPTPYGYSSSYLLTEGKRL